MSTIMLYRPVGLREMQLIAEARGQAFPPRLPEQPIFYPVLNRPYAAQIAQQWNAPEAFSGFVGFVTAFEVDEAYASRYPRQVVGASRHEELWVPAEELPAFNRHIVGGIRLVAAYYGERYAGLPPASAPLAGLPPAGQLARWAELYRQSAAQFADVFAADWLTVYVNVLLWSSPEGSGFGVADAERAAVLQAFAQLWNEQYGFMAWPVYDGA